MEYILVIAHVTVIWMLAVMTPGANVLLTINTALQYERRLALFAAYGVSVAILLWSLLGGSGLVILFSHFPQLFNVMKLIGGMYLLYLGCRQIYTTRKAKRLGDLGAHGIIAEPSKKKMFVLAFVTSILNPKTGFFVVSLFSVSVPQSMNWVMILLVMLTMFSITLLWHICLATLFSHQSAKRVYSRVSSVMNYVTGGLFTLFGIKVMSS